MSSAALFLLFTGAAFEQSATIPQKSADQPRNDGASSSVRAAESALEKGDYPAAIAQLKLLAADRPHDAQIIYDLGYAEERTGNDAEAAQDYADALRAAPEAVEPKLALGLLDARAGRTQKAHAELSDVSSKANATPELRARALRALAVLDERTHPDAAREDLLQAIKLTSETPDDISLGARLAAQAGSPAEAEQAYRRALAADPDNVDAATDLAGLLARSGKLAEAERTLEGARKAHPNDPRVVSQLAAIYGQRGKAEEGISLLQTARATDPAFASNPAATRMLARLEALAGKNEEAAHMYAELVQSDTADPMLLDEYGGTLVKLARYGEAQAIFNKALGMKPAFPAPEDWAETASHLAFAASRNHQPKTALQALALRATVLPNSPSSLFLQAISYDALRQNGEAVKAYRAFLSVAGGKYPDQEFQARHRLIALEHTR